MCPPLLTGVRTNDIGYAEHDAKRDALSSTRGGGAVRLEVLDLGAAGDSDARRRPVIHGDGQGRGDIRQSCAGRPAKCLGHCGVRVERNRHGRRELGTSVCNRSVDQTNATPYDDVSRAKARSPVRAARPQHNCDPRWELQNASRRARGRRRKADPNQSADYERLADVPTHRIPECGT